MIAFLIRRAAFGVATLFAVLTLVFVIVRILPGDPAQLILGDQASREAIEALHARLGLDQPIPLQYLSFLANALRGDWGVSMVTGQPVLAEVLNVLPWTIDLTLVSLALGLAWACRSAFGRQCGATASSIMPCEWVRLQGFPFPPLSPPSSFCSFLRSNCIGFR
jgi:ABC-type dipeptide/oligopeptide/nickel transport system permease component